MPNKMIYALAKKHDIPADELEKKWDKAKKIVTDQYGTTNGKFGIVMIIFKRMANISEEKMRFIEFNQISSDLLEFKSVTDEIFVYHGFNNIDDGIDAIVNGLSGKSKTSRLYSYEADNNPNGLFVTPDLKLAKSFGKIVIGFTANVSELEAPIWPANSTLTPKGGMSGVFGGGRNGRIARNNAIKDEERRLRKSENPDVANSVSPRLQNSLFNWALEPQALFIGHLNPNRIKFISVMQSDNVLDWVDLSIQEFKQKFELVGTKNSKKIFKPDDNFSEAAFYSGLTSQMKFLSSLKIDKMIHTALSGDTPQRSFVGIF